jgi:hypothetical protein
MVARRLVPVLIALLSLAVTLQPAHTEERNLTRGEYISQVSQRIDAIQKTWSRGKRGEAIRLLRVLDAEMNLYAEFMGDSRVFWWPDLQLIRYLVVLKEYDEVQDLAAPLLRALDNDTDRGSKERLEAMYILARSLAGQGRWPEAEVLLRAFMRDRTDEVGPQIALDAEAFLSAAVTSTKAPDAEEIRARLLNGYMQREGARLDHYLILLRRDLNARRQNRSDSEKLLADARAALAFVRATPDATGQGADRLLDELGRVFVATRDYANAEPLQDQMMRRKKAEDPEGVEYYWSVQNMLELRRLQKKLPEAMALGQTALDALDGKPDQFARVAASIAYTLGMVVKDAGDKANAQVLFQRAYAETRRVAPANDDKALKYRRALDISNIDPDSFPYAEELGATRRGRLVVSAHGTSTLERFWQGDGARTLAALERAMKNEKLDQATVALNLALLRGLMGLTGTAMEALLAAREMAAEPGSKLKPDDAWLDATEAMILLYVRDWKPEDGAAAIGRLAAREDLNDDQARMLPVFRMLLGNAIGDHEMYQTWFDVVTKDYDPMADLTPWGLTRALAISGVSPNALPVDRAADLQAGIAEAFEAAGGPATLVALQQVFIANSQPGALDSEQRFQELAFHLRTLSRTLPRDHQWQIIGREVYSRGLFARGFHEESHALLKATIADYRASPWHRPDVHGFLTAQLAASMHQMGQIELGEALLAEVAQTVDLDTWRPFYAQSVITFQAATLTRNGQAAEGLRLIGTLLARDDVMARLEPIDRATIYQLAGGIYGALGETDTELAMLTRARETLPAPGYQLGVPLSNILLDTARVHFQGEDYDAAWTAITASNGLWFDAQAQISDSADGEIVRNRDVDRTKAIEEAVMGWVMFHGRN